MRRLVIVVAFILGASTTAAFAASLGVGTWHVWAGSQSLTKSTCTVTGAADDTYIDESSATTNYGTTAYVGARTGTSQRAYSFVRFDLSSCSIPSTGGADSATLKLTVLQAPTSSRTIAVAPVQATWTEGALNWNTGRTLAVGSNTTTFSTGTTTTTLSIPVTADVDGWIQGGTNYGWRLMDTGTGTFTTVFDSSEATSGKPQLVINYEK
jgi:hypothetical protein